MLTSIDVIITYRREEYKIHDNKRCSLAHIRPQIPVIICATFTVLATFLENSLTIFFAKQLHHALLLSFSRTIIRKSGSSLRISANIFQIWSKEAGYEEIAVGFRPMRNGKIFKRIISSYWMRSSMIWRILQIKVCYAPYRHGFSNSFESQLKPLVFVTFSFFQYVLNFKTCLPRSM